MSVSYYRRQYEEGISVVARPDESLHELLRRFKKKYTRSGLSLEMRERMFFKKPSIKKKKKKEIARRRRIREEERLLKERKKYGRSSERTTSR